MPITISELVEQAKAFYELYSPWAITELHMIGSALLPIYAGAHASLSRPLSAAKATKKQPRGARGKDEDRDNKMEGLSPTDAISFPILAGVMLTGLYYLIKWLQDPAILNKIINAYISVFGLIAIAQFLTDAMNTAISFVLPSQYRYKGNVWEALPRKQHFKAMSRLSTNKQPTEPNPSPWPGVFSTIRTPRLVDSLVWNLRNFISKPLYVIEFYIRGAVEASIAVGPLRDLNNVVGLGVVLYYNFVHKPWWLTNLYGFSMTYGSLQLMSPTTFWTGTLILSALFFYDIYFVFFTPMMITVATKIDAPIKLLIPRPTDERDDPTKLAVSMLGLGDIVVPGMMMGLALRFDLYMFYLKRQRRRNVDNEHTEGNRSTKKSKLQSATLKDQSSVVYDKKGVGRVVYKRATGNWGERFWLGAATTQQLEGCIFPKPYFYASIIGYVSGMLVTLAVMHIFQHGQPALLYLVPGVLGSLWGTALIRGELKHMWNYSELDEEEAAKEKEKTAANTKAVKQRLEQTQEVVKRSITGDQPVDSSGDEDNPPANHPEEVANERPTKGKLRKRKSQTLLAEAEGESGPNPDTLPSFASYENLPITRPSESLFTMSIRLLPVDSSSANTNSDSKVNAQAARSLRSAAQLRKTGPGGEEDVAENDGEDFSNGKRHVEKTEEPPLEASPARNTRARRTLHRA